MKPDIDQLCDLSERIARGEALGEQCFGAYVEHIKDRDYVNEYQYCALGGVVQTLIQDGLLPSWPDDEREALYCTYPILGAKITDLERKGHSEDLFDLIVTLNDVDKLARSAIATRVLTYKEQL